MADGNGFSALRNDAGEARHDEAVERVADLCHVHAVDSGYAADARGPGEFSTRFCAVFDRRLVCDISLDRDGFKSFHLYFATLLFEVRASARVAGEPRVQLQVKQPGAAGGLFHN